MNFLTLMAQQSSASSGTGSKSGGIQMIVLLVLMVAVMYFTMIRPQKKRQKQEQQMRNDLEVGDEITTVGGIVGRVVTVKEDSLIIETGADRTRLKITRAAIGTNNTKQEQLEAERAAAKAAQDAARKERMSSLGKGKKKKKDEE